MIFICQRFSYLTLCTETKCWRLLGYIWRVQAFHTYMSLVYREFHHWVIATMSLLIGMLKKLQNPINIFCITHWSDEDHHLKLLSLYEKHIVHACASSVGAINHNQIETHTRGLIHSYTEGKLPVPQTNLSLRVNQQLSSLFDITIGIVDTTIRFTYTTIND